jgi:cystathionine beta-synthase
MIENQDVKDFNIADVQEAALPVVDMDTPLERLKHYINKDNGAVLTRDDSGQYHILTKYDVLNAFSKG